MAPSLPSSSYEADQGRDILSHSVSSSSSKLEPMAISDLPNQDSKLAQISNVNVVPIGEEDGTEDEGNKRLRELGYQGELERKFGGLSIITVGLVSTVSLSLFPRVTILDAHCSW